MNRDQAAALLVLAAGAQLGTGQTISAQAEAAQDKAQAAGKFGHSGPPKKVATALGSAHYKAPIGSLIIPHEHFIKGQPSHWSPGISESKWVANYWKDHDKAEDAAHQAVNAGTHRWVQAGDHEVAAHKSLEVHVPKDTDTSDPVKVKDAPKVFVKKDQDGKPVEHMALLPQYPATTTPGPTNDAAADTLAAHYKKLDSGTASQKAVAFDGKLAAWVPSDWKVYKAAGHPDSEMNAKWAKDPQGKWHQVTKEGEINWPDAGTAAPPDQWVSDGVIVPDDSAADQHGMAPQDAGPSKPQVDVGGVAVTKEEIQKALEHLGNDHSTAVKQPLAKKGHPLAAMDYHGVAKAELAKHPELKVEAGTKKAHVGQVKLAVMHHLSGRLAHLSKTEAETAAQEAVQDKAQADAEHAQLLTPHMYDIGGTKFARNEVQAAIDALEGTKSTAIKQTLQHLGSPLAEVDYHALIDAYKADHPNTAPEAHGTKQEHVGNAKAVFVAALKEKAGLLAQQDEAAGYDDAAELYDLVNNGTFKTAGSWGVTKVGAIAKAAEDANMLGQNVYVVPSSGAWAAQLAKPSPDEAYQYVTPQLKLFGHDPGGMPEQEMPTLLWNAVHLWFAPKVDAASLKEVLAKEIEKAHPEPSLQPQVDDFIKELKAHPERIYGSGEWGVIIARPLAWALWYAGPSTEYVIPQGDNKWGVSIAKPATGTFGASQDAGFYQVTPDHKVTWFSKEGDPLEVSPKAVLDTLKVGTKSPEEPEDVWVTYAGVKYSLPAGTKVYQDDKGAETGYFYAKTPDGKWYAYTKYTQGVPDAGTGYDNLLDGGAFHQVTPPFKGPNPAHDKPPLADQPATPQPGVVVNGTSFPAGTKVYYLKDSPDGVHYAKTPDYQWHYVYQNGNTANGDATWDTLVAGSSQYVLQEHPDEPATATPPTQDASGPTVAAMKDGVYYGEYPAGSKIYQLKGTSYPGQYARSPDGQWWYANGYGYSGNMIHKVEHAPSYMISDEQFAQGQLTEVKPPAEEETALAKKIAGAVAAIKHGSMDPSHSTGEWSFGYSTEKVFKTWQAVAVYALATEHQGSSQLYIVPAEGGFAYKGNINNSKTDEYWRVSSDDLHVTHSAPGDEEQKVLPADELVAAVNRYVQPNSVVVGGKQYKFGFWKNPKGKASVQIKPFSGYYLETYKYGSAANASYVYYDSSGSPKDITPKAAVKQLEKATEFSLELPAPDFAQPGTKATNVETLKLGSYKVWSTDSHAPDKASVVNVYDDLSGLLHGIGSPTPLTKETLKNLVKAGALLDQYGTSVVMPGSVPDTFHLFGSEGKTKAELEQLQHDFEVGWNGKTSPDSTGPSWQAATLEFFTGSKTGPMSETVKDDIKSFMGDSNYPANGDGQRSAVYNTLKELLAIPQLPEGTKLNQGGGGSVKQVKEPTFLKGMPEGISSSKDVFTWTETGNAVPYHGTINASPDIYYDKAESKSVIQGISQQFGGGKVVGTHLAGMSKANLDNWLKAWKAGDMSAVYEIDAQAGKLSPAHPGAPDNADTHHVTWSPLDPHQVPASQVIEGAWSETSFGSLPANEVDNYLIKMGFQHAEYLLPSQKNSVVVAHRNHEQDKVDSFTSLVKQQVEEGLAAVSQPPTWTDGLKPAKPYDSYVHDSTPAHSWSNSAVITFAHDNFDALQPYLAEQGEQMGYTVAEIVNGEYVSMEMNAIQSWLDNEHEKEVAAQSVPVWAQVPTGSLPSHGHEVLKATRTIPYTGEQTTWFVKPAPDGKEYRIEQEHAANLLGRALGFASAESQLLHDKAFGPGEVQAQRAIPGEPLGYYTDMPDWNQFDAKQLADIAGEHMLDHLLFNDDTSANNMIKRPDGHIVGIDKGRAWGNLDWASLDPKAMDSMTQTVYAKLYSAIEHHQVSKTLADQAYVSLIQKARKIEKVPDAKLQSILEAGFESRPAGKWGPYGSRQGLIDEVIRRKNNLSSDFAKLWGQVYESADFGNVKGSDFGAGKPWGAAPESDPRFGTVVFGTEGGELKVLLRQPKGNFGGAHWTFSKGGPENGETPLQTAVRETAEETQHKWPVVGYVPGQFSSTHSGSHNYFYLGTREGGFFTPKADNGETADANWYTLEEAKAKIGESDAVVAKRDLQILDAAAKAWKALPENPPPFDPYQMSAALPDVPVIKLSEAPGGYTQFSGFSEDGLAEAVAKSKSHGYPAYFGGRELRDMHVLLWRQPDSNGGQATHGETFLKGDALSSVVQWLSAHEKSPSVQAQDVTTALYPGGDLGPGKPPGNSLDRGGVKGETQWYTTIVEAAHTVTKHKMDGQYNADRMTALTDLMVELNGKQDSTVPNVAAVAKHYLGLIAQVQKAKTEHMGFGPTDLPRWVAPSAPEEPKPADELSALGIKLNYGTAAYHDGGAIDKETGQFVSHSPSGHHDPGHWWKLTLPEGETIEIGDSDYHGVELSHHGRVRFTSPTGDAASLERIRAALQVTGLSMREAEQQDFEAFYWRHLLAILDDRGDGHQGKQQGVWNELKNQFNVAGLPWKYGDGDKKHTAIIDALEELGKNDPSAELQAYRRAFGTLTSDGQVSGFLENGGALPHLKHFDPTSPTAVGGKPDWYRFDMLAGVEHLPMPIRQSSDTASTAPRVAYSGGSYGRDALMRVVGEETHSSLGNPYETGGPAYVFTRLNVASGRTIMFSPLTLLRTKNYQFPGDQFGEWLNRKAGVGGSHGGGSPSYWSADKWKHYSDMGNETMISDALSLLDDVELVASSDPETRQKVIDYLKARGLGIIRFMPVEDRIVHHITEKEIAKVHANWAAHPELLDPLREPGVYTGATEPDVVQADSGKLAQEEAQPEPPKPETMPADAVVYVPNPDGGAGFNPDGTWGKAPDGTWWVFPPDMPTYKVSADSSDAKYLQQMADEGELMPQGGKPKPNKSGFVKVVTFDNGASYELAGDAVVFKAAPGSTLNEQARWAMLSDGSWIVLAPSASGHVQVTVGDSEMTEWVNKGMLVLDNSYDFVKQGA